TTGNTIAVTQNDAEQTFNLDLPGRSDVSARNLSIEASPSIAGALFGALDYLTSYPYGCTEQTMSSFLPNIVVAQTLKDIPTAKATRTFSMSCMASATTWDRTAARCSRSLCRNVRTAARTKLRS